MHAGNGQIIGNPSADLVIDTPSALLRLGRYLLAVPMVSKVGIVNIINGPLRINMLMEYLRLIRSSPRAPNCQAIGVLPGQASQLANT